MVVARVTKRPIDRPGKSSCNIESEAFGVGKGMTGKEHLEAWKLVHKGTQPESQKELLIITDITSFGLALAPRRNRAAGLSKLVAELFKLVERKGQQCIEPNTVALKIGQVKMLLHTERSCSPLFDLPAIDGENIALILVQLYHFWQRKALKEVRVFNGLADYSSLLLSIFNAVVDGPYEFRQIRNWLPGNGTQPRLI